jgi:hypothetical protein
LSETAALTKTERAGVGAEFLPKLHRDMRASELPRLYGREFADAFARADDLDRRAIAARAACFAVRRARLDDDAATGAVAALEGDESPAALRDEVVALVEHWDEVYFDAEAPDGHTETSLAAFAKARAAASLASVLDSADEASADALYEAAHAVGGQPDQELIETVRILLVNLNPIQSVIAAALAEQDKHHASGFTSATPLRWAVQRQLDPEALRDLVRELRQSDDVAERELSASLLAQAPLPGPIVLEEARSALQGENDGHVIGRLLEAIAFSHQPDALPELHKLADHPDAQVRYLVPDALSGCGAPFDDVEGDLTKLSGDTDCDVRWSATYELTAWLREPDDATTAQRTRILARLHELAANDPDEDVRSLAAENLSEHDVSR